MRKGTAILVAMMISALGSGCVRHETRPVPEPDPIDVALAKAASAIEQSWARENAIAAAARKPAARATSPARLPLSAFPPAARVHVDMDWEGEVAGVVRAFAEAMGIRFSESGIAPVPPVLVSIHAVDQPIAWLLQEAGQQAGDRAEVVLGDQDVMVVYRDREGMKR